MQTKTPTTRSPNPKDRWWLWALIAAAFAMLEAILLRFIPASFWAWLPLVGAAVFIAMMFCHPATWYRRMSSYCLTAAGLVGTVPGIAANIEVTDFGKASILIDNSPWLAIALVIAGVVFGILDHYSRTPQQHEAPQSTQSRQFVQESTGGFSTQGDGSPNIVGQNVNVSIENKSTADAKTLDMIVSRYESVLQRSDSELQRSESDNDELRAQLADALKRAESVADAGDLSAKEAVDQARQTGDVEELQAVLIREADKLGDAVKEQMAEYVELCREIAATAYVRGDILEAEKRLRIIIRVLPNDRHAHNQLGRVFGLRGELADAEEQFRRVLGLSSEDLVGLATALGNLGIIERIRGNLDAAKKLNGKALEINRRLGRLGGQDAILGNLGIVEQTRGNLDAAEKLHRESLEINRRLGRLEGQANQLASLGLIEQMRGNTDAAEKLHRESLEINRKLEYLEGQAKQLGNLGLIEQMRGNIDAAEILLRESLEIDRRLGHLEGQANQLGNLGLIEQTRGNVDAAGKLHRESLEIDRKLGRLEGQARTLGNLGLIESNCGNLDAAEKLYRGALDINRKLGRIQGQAIQLTNLGIIEQLRGNLAEAKEVWTQALVLFENTGMKLEAENIRRQLDKLPPE